MRKVLLIITFLLVTFIGLRRTSAPFFSVKKYHCIQTGVISDDYFSSIKNSVADLLDHHSSAHALINHLKKEYPIVSAITVAYRPCGVYVTMNAHTPICCINDSLILTSDNELFSKNAFSVSALDDIAEITVAQESMTKAPLLVSSLLGELPSDFNQTYTLELVNEHCVRLIDKREHNFTVVSSVAQKKIATVLAQCVSVKKNIGERKGFAKGIKWIADTRFADYIVAYKA